MLLPFGRCAGVANSQFKPPPGSETFHDNIRARTPSPGSAVFDGATAAEKVLPLPPPLHRKRRDQAFHGQVRRKLPVQNRLDDRGRQVGQAQDPADKRGVDVLGFGDVRDRGVG